MCNIINESKLGREGKERELIAIFWLMKSKQTHLTSKIITMSKWKNLGMFVLIS